MATTIWQQQYGNNNMVTRDLTPKRILLCLLKDFSSMHTITTLAKELGLSRVGVWKILRKLEEGKYVSLKSVGKGKTSASIVKINWENILVEKTVSLYLIEEAIKQKRWQANFFELDKVVGFSILYGSIVHSPQEANDIDLLGITPKKNFVEIQIIIDKIQKTQSKKIHSINFTESEFKAELQKPNQAFIEAIKKGVILFGQEKFVKFIKEITS